jgi:hypothetical protein
MVEITTFPPSKNILVDILSLLDTPDWLNCWIASRRFHVDSEEKIEERRTVVPARCKEWIDNSE